MLAGGGSLTLPPANTYEQTRTVALAASGRRNTLKQKETCSIACGTIEV